MADTPEPGGLLLDRLAGAVNRRDVDEIAACFSSDYRNETPAHPARGFSGVGQVRRNWEQILAAVPDLTCRVLRQACEREVVWSEWEMVGTRRDGSAHGMAGVIVFGVRDGRFAWARFYLEPVEVGGMDVNAAVRRQVCADPRSLPPVSAGPRR